MEDERQHISGQRYDFEMNHDQLEKLFEACRPIPLIMLQYGMPRSTQERANSAWCSLGDDLGFDGMSVIPSNKGDRFFSAIAKLKIEK